MVTVGDGNIEDGEGGGKEERWGDGNVSKMIETLYKLKFIIKIVCVIFF